MFIAAQVHQLSSFKSLETEVQKRGGTIIQEEIPAAVANDLHHLGIRTLTDLDRTLRVHFDWLIDNIGERVGTNWVLGALHGLIEADSHRL